MNIFLKLFFGLFIFSLLSGSETSDDSCFNLVLSHNHHSLITDDHIESVEIIQYPRLNDNFSKRGKIILTLNDLGIRQWKNICEIYSVNSYNKSKLINRDFYINFCSDVSFTGKFWSMLSSLAVNSRIKIFYDYILYSKKIDIEYHYNHNHEIDEFEETIRIHFSKNKKLADKQ